MRPHISLNVRNVTTSAVFYEKVFAAPPQKLTKDYAKFDLREPPLNFSLVSTGGKISRINHLGIEMTDAEAVETWKARLGELGIVEQAQENVTCCFARQDKVWFSDPDGNNWEVFFVHEQLPVDGSLEATGCCTPKTGEATEPAAHACGCQ